MRWTERIEDPNIWRVYIATLGLGLSYGMAISLIPLLLHQQGYAKQEIGTLAAWFAGGIVALSLPMGALIKRFGAKNTLVTSFFGYAVTVTVFPFLPSYSALAGVRFFDGAFSVGIWVSFETILLALAGSKHKAFVMSLYAISMALGYFGGPLLAFGTASVAPLAAGFVSAGVVATLAGLYVAFNLETNTELGSKAVNAESAEKEPEPDALATGDEGDQASVRSLVWSIKNSCFATFSYGYFQASVVLFLPLFLIESKGITERQTILIPMFFAAGMLLFASFAGRAGDRFGHLFIMRCLAVVGGSMILGFVYLETYALMCAAVFVAGATLASISPVSLALQGVVVSRQSYSRANAIYNAFYAAGMLLGPPVSSILFEKLGGPAMLYHLAGLWGAFVLFTLAFYRDDPAARSLFMPKARPAA